ERPSRADIRHELECRLAEAVLEVLPARPEAIRAQQELALGARHERHLLGGIARARRPPAAAGSGPRRRAAAPASAVEVVRHIWVSDVSAIAPPSKFLPCQAPRVRAGEPAHRLHRSRAGSWHRARPFI